MNDLLATGRIDIDLNDKDAVAGLRALDAQFDRTMRSIENKEGEVTVRANAKKLKEDLRAAEKEVEKFEKDIAAREKKRDNELKGAQKGAETRRINAAKAELKILKDSLPLYRQRAQAADEHLKTVTAANKELTTSARKEAALESAVKRTTKAQNDRARAEQRAAVERTKAERERITGASREASQVEKLQAAWNKAYEAHRRAELRSTKARTIFSRAAQQRVAVDDKRALVEMEKLRAELQVLGHKPVDQYVDLKLREEHTGAGFFANLAKTLGDSAVRLGPFTTSIGTLGKALALLGPIVTGVVGHLGALAAVIGSGIGGAAVASAGALGALGVSLGGVGFLLPSLLRDFSNLTRLQDAYHKKVLEEGKNAPKTVVALEKYKHALGAVTPTTRKAFLTLDELQGRWRKMRKEARPDFFNALGEGITTVNHHFDWFKKNTLGAFHEVTAGWNQWMKALRSSEADRVLHTLGKNGNASIKPLLHGLGELVGWFGKIAASASKELPDLFKGFDRWATSLNKAVDNEKKLDGQTHGMIESMKTLGHFTTSVARWLVALFAPGVETGRKALEGYSDALDRSTARMKEPGGRDKLTKFFREATKTSEEFIKAVAPFAQIFFEWTTIMRPFTNVMIIFLRILGNVLQTVLDFGPAKGIFQAAFGVFLAGKLIKSVATVGSSMWNLYKAVSALKAAGGIGGAIKGGLIKFATGGLRGTTPANPLYTFQVNGGPGGGGAPGGVVNKGKGGIGAMVGRLPNFAKFAGGLGLAAGAAVALGAALDKIADKRSVEKNDKQLRKLVDQRNINGIKSLQKEYEKFGKTPPPKLQKAIDEIKRLNSLDAGKLANNVRHNWANLTANTHTTFKDIQSFASRSFQIIKNNTKKRSEEAEKAVSQNFRSASRAIRNAIRDGKVSSEEGTKAIRDLWAKTLTEFGLSKRQARNIAKGNSLSGGRENSGSGDVGGAARGGLFTVGGRAGVAAHDNVPAVLNGQRALVAKGEQVAVFNRHQQAEMNATLPGGLAGFFARNRKPHYAARGGLFGDAARYAGGGIVPVPGFPGESAASSVIGMIEMIARKFHVALTDAFGSGHKSPGHTVTGTAADFSGPDANMDAAVRFLTSKGYLVGYDGRFGSQDWPGHGPSSRTSNYHFHVELGGKSGGGLGGMMLEAIKAPQMAKGLGSVSLAGQAMLNSATSAANWSLEQVGAGLSAPTAGGGGGVGGGGAASRAQMVEWARRALTATTRLGHGGPTAGNINKLLTLAMKESSWIPNSINNWDINAKQGNPSGGLMHVTLDKVGGSKAALFDPVTNMIASIVYQMKRYHDLITFSPYAKGGLVGERGKELIADNRTGSVRMVNKPTITNLTDSQSVIPTGSKGAPILERFAQKMGIPAFAGGRNAPNTNEGSGNLKSRGSRGKKKRRALSSYNPEKIPSVKKYRSLEDAEDRLNARIEILDRTVREPEDLVVPSGRKDANGEPEMVANVMEINRYRGELNALIAAQEEMQGKPDSILDQMKRLYGPVIKDLNRYRDIHTRSKNAIKSAIARDQAIADAPLKGPDKKHLKRQQAAARKRIAKNKNRLEKEKTALDEEKTTRGDISDDHKDLTQRRYDTARLDREDQYRIRDAVQGNIDEALASANPAADSGGTTDDGGLSYGGQKSLLDTAIAQVYRDFGSNYNPNVGALLAGAPGSSTPGLGTLGGMQNNQAGIASVLGSLVGTTTTAGSSLTATTSGSAEAAATMGALNTRAADTRMAGAISSGVASGIATGGTSKTVNITNHFQAPPADPLTWSKGVEFEAGAAI